MQARLVAGVQAIVKTNGCLHQLQNKGKGNRRKAISQSTCLGLQNAFEAPSNPQKGLFQKEAVPQEPKEG